MITDKRDRSEYFKQYREKNREKIKRKSILYRTENKEKIKEYYKKNKERIKYRVAKYNKKNREKILEYKKLHYQKNREKKLEYAKDYHQRNKEKRSEYNKQYRKTFNGKLSHKASYHKYKLLTSDLTMETVQRVYEDNIKKYGTLTCILCYKPIKFGQDALEHKTPVSRGGSNEYENLGIAHGKNSEEACNSKKRAMTLEEWQLRQVTK